MKKQIIPILTFLLCTVFSLTGCSDDKDDLVADPQNTRTAEIYEDSFPIGNECKIYWTPGNQLNCDYGLSIIGPLNGLGNININTLPEGKSWASQVLCMPGWGYMARHGVLNTETGEQEYTYSAFYLVQSLYNDTGVTIGAQIKYCPFTPGKGWD